MSRWLFVAERLNWPRSSGTDVHGTQMMRALARRGHAVSLGLFGGAPPEALAGLGLEDLLNLAPPLRFGEGAGGVRLPFGSNLTPPTPLSETERGGKDRTPLEARVERYWGTDPARVAAVADAARRVRADAVVALGADAYTYLRGVRDAVRIWYAADEAALFHLSQLDPLRRASWHHLRSAASRFAGEFAFRRRVDRVWVVSGPDRAAMRLAMPGVAVDLIPNGVDAEHYAPPEPPPAEIPRSAVFWGRLDFGPNEDALRWFLTDVWPGVGPGATFDVFGFQPTPAVEELCRRPGVTLTADVPDLRPEIARRQVAVFPFVSGRGVKNKLLEAAAMARPIAGTPRVRNGLEGNPPLALAASPAGLRAELERLWADAGARARLGAAARAWALRRHSWDRSAALAERGIAGAGRRGVG